MKRSVCESVRLWARECVRLAESAADGAEEAQRAASRLPRVLAVVTPAEATQADARMARDCATKAGNVLWVVSKETARANARDRARAQAWHKFATAAVAVAEAEAAAAEALAARAAAREGAQ